MTMGYTAIITQFKPHHLKKQLCNRATLIGILQSLLLTLRGFLHLIHSTLGIDYHNARTSIPC